MFIIKREEGLTERRVREDSKLKVRAVCRAL